MKAPIKNRFVFVMVVMKNCLHDASCCALFHISKFKTSSQRRAKIDKITTIDKLKQQRTLELNKNPSIFPCFKRQRHLI